MNKQSQTEEDIKMFFFIDKDIFISPFDPMKIMIHLYFCSRYIMYLQLAPNISKELHALKTDILQSILPVAFIKKLAIIHCEIIEKM